MDSCSSTPSLNWLKVFIAPQIKTCVVPNLVPTRKKSFYGNARCNWSLPGHFWYLFCE